MRQAQGLNTLRKIMQTDRREFLTLAAAGLSTELLTLSAPRALPSTKIRAIAFDAFAIFDPTPIQRTAEQLFPENGVELANLWRVKQFEYQWLHALIGSYADFWRCTEDSLAVAAKVLNLDLTIEKQNGLMNCYLQLKPWSEVSAALKNLNNLGLRLAFLSNATLEMLQACIKNSGLRDLFEQVLSTDRLRTFKPSPRAYQMAADAFAFRKDEVLFVAFAGWDAVGAKAFGYPTFWVNRANLPAERLGFIPDGIGKNLNDLVAFVKV